jgi:hypothetical protein
MDYVLHSTLGIFVYSTLFDMWNNHYGNIYILHIISHGEPLFVELKHSPTIFYSQTSFVFSLEKINNRAGSFYNESDAHTACHKENRKEFKLITSIGNLYLLERIPPQELT